MNDRPVNTPTPRSARSTQSTPVGASHLGWLLALVFAPAVALGVWHLVQLAQRLLHPG